MNVPRGDVKHGLQKAALLMIVVSLAIVRSTAAAENVTSNGSYKTSFEVPVPPAPAAPSIVLNYDSSGNGSLAGTGWDLSAGWPASIVRDVRFGTPEWKRGSAWLWGANPLVPANNPQCAWSVGTGLTGDCTYRFRVAPDALTAITIDLTAAHEHATAHLPNGTTVEYESVSYGGDFPQLPAGAETPVLQFRLSSVVDRNGYLTCFAYELLTSQEKQQGIVAGLQAILYGPPPSQVHSCADVEANSSSHRITFSYVDRVQRGFFSSWTLRFGARIAFRKLLERITTYANGADVQDSFVLAYDGRTSETKRPRLVKIVQQILNSQGQEQDSRILRTFAYGDRSPSYANAEVLDLGPLGSFPDSLSGSVGRPIRRASLLGDPNGLFQPGQDQDSDAAPLTHATTEQWGFIDLNGDGLPDWQWGIEKGSDRLWNTFETSPPPFGPQMDVSQRPVQQKVIINDGVADMKLASSVAQIDSHAPLLETSYFPAPTNRSSVPIGGFTSWIWGEGRGQTRTGMPVSVSGAEIMNPAPPPGCPHQSGQDPRIWPTYPDGTEPIWGSGGSAAGGFIDLGSLTLDPGNPVWAGAPGVLNAIEGIYKGLQPSYSISASTSGWLDLNGDGLPEFVVTPSWIDRFSFDFKCFDFKSGDLLNEAATQTLDSLVARQGFPAIPGKDGPAIQWHSMSLSAPGTSGQWNELNLDSLVPSGQLSIPSGPPGPIGMPISYETTTASSRGFGFTLPIGSLVTASIASWLSGSWIPIASAAPGLTVDSFAPRNAPGYTLSIRGPSATGVLEGLGNIATSTEASSASSVYGFIMSTINANFDLTLVSPQNTTRSETRAELMDINGDGLPDYLLYTTGEIKCTARDGQVVTIPPSSLVAYLNSSTGFDCPQVINSGFNYTIAAPTLSVIELKLGTATTLADSLVGISGAPSTDECQSAPEAAVLCTLYFGSILTRPDTLTLPLDQACKTAFCFLYELKLAEIARTSDDIMGIAGPFILQSHDAIPQERSELSDINTLTTFLRSWGLSDQLHPDLASVDGTTAAARALVMDLGYIARTLQHIGYSSRINIVAQGISELDQTGLGSPAAGVAAQTRGFVDLNGDGLPDYVITDDPEPKCQPGEWEVFWGTGTSSISAGRAFLPNPECVQVPIPPSELVQKGFSTLPLNADLVLRRPTNNAQIVDTVADSFVSLNDVNRDGRPDIVIAGDTWNADTASQTWHVFLNTGEGFESSASLNIPSPQQQPGGLETAACANPDLFRSCIDIPIDVPYPAIRTTHAVGNTGMARDTSETHAAMIDIDGDGTPEVVRRVHTLGTDPTDNSAKREALLVWRRPNIGGPQDLMYEERFPVDGSRRLIEYKSSSAFQWKDGQPNGAPPQLGHYSLAGVPAQLVRSITNEPFVGRPDQRTHQNFDYKSPYFDMNTRMFAGFAERTSDSADPATGQQVEGSVGISERNLQRADGLPGVSQARVWIPEHGTGAQVPLTETFTSYAASQPTTLTPALGGLTSIFSVPTDVLKIEYPTRITRAAILDIGFDGREPFRDRSTGRNPIGATPQTLRSSCSDVQSCQELATGGAVQFVAGSFPIAYPSPHAASAGGSAPIISEATIETWVRPTDGTEDHVVVVQPGAYRLAIRIVNGAPRWSLDVLGVTRVVSNEDIQLNRWQQVVATFGALGGRYSSMVESSGRNLLLLGHRLQPETFLLDVTIPRKERHRIALWETLAS